MSKQRSVVRIAAQDPNLVKSYLDLGADALMVPNIESADQAKEVVCMMRYPPQGYRGVGGSMRSTNYFRNAANYYALVQRQRMPDGADRNAEGLRESGCHRRSGWRRCDLLWSLTILLPTPGLLGQPGHAYVMAKIEAGMKRCMRQPGQGIGHSVR